MNINYSIKIISIEEYSTIKRSNDNNKKNTQLCDKIK